MAKILNLNHEQSNITTNGHEQANALTRQTTPILNSDGDPIWKVLVFDDLGRDVISSVLRVNDLRGYGVTIHLYVSPMSHEAALVAEPLLKLCRNINAQRHPIHDVPVLYLLEPTAANLSLISTDLSRSLYADAYINFLSSIPRPLMEDFAAQLAESGTAESVAQMYDQYLNFIVGEPDLFSLGMGKDAYWALNSAKTTDEEIDVLVDRTVSGLFSVVVTMGMRRKCREKG